MKFTNLDTNETVEVNSYGGAKFILVPAVLVYWGAANIAIDNDDQGTLVRGKANSDLILDYIDKKLGDYKKGYNIRQLIGPKTARPFVNDDGERVLRLASPAKGTKNKPVYDEAADGAATVEVYYNND